LKNKRRMFSVLIILSLFLSVFLAGCSYQNPTSSGTSSSSKGSSSNKTNTTSDVIKVGLDVDAGTMDPRLAKDTSAQRVQDLVYDGLIRLDDNLKPVPDLATKWETPNPTTYIFTLRKDVKFQDGTPFTASDVKYTYDSILDPKFQAPYASLYEPIKSVDVIDNYTVKFTLKRPYAPLLSYLNLGIVPKHIGEKNDNSLATKPIGTGPYKMVSWDKNSKISFEANENYWAGAPKTKNITYYIIPDNTTRVAALESGDVDLVHSPVSPQDVQRIKGESDKYTVFDTEGLGYTYLDFNTKNSTLSDVKVRQAIAYLIDKKTISSDIYQNMDKPAGSPLIPLSWAYSDSIKGFSYDPAKSKALFKEAGWTDSNGDGILDKNGKKLTITLSTHTEDPNRVQSVEYLQNVFKKNGIETKVSTSEFPTFSTNLMNGKFDIALVGWLNLTDPDKAMYNQFYSTSGSNYGKYSNSTVDKLLDQGRSVLDQNKRKQIYQQAAQIVTNEVAYDVLLYQGYIAMYNNKLTGFKPNSTGSFYGLKDAVINN
jgi:peptide/nickel transport system substrate-binding protein